MASLLLEQAIINTLTPNATVVGNTGAAAAQAVVLGLVGAGSLTIQDRGSLTTFIGGALGLPLGRGDVTVTGPGSVWTNINGGIQVGGNQQGAISTLTVADGGLVNGSFFGVPISVGGGGGFGVLRGDGTVTSTQINARGILAPGVFPAPGLVGTPGTMSVVRQSRIPVRRVLRRAGQSHDGLDHQCERHRLACRHRGGSFRAGQLRLAHLHDFDGRGRGHRHVRRARHLRLAGRFRTRA